MITPRQTRLVRVVDPDAFRRAIRTLAAQPPEDTARVIVVPTRGAAVALGLPAAVTRDELYERLRARLDPAPPRLTPFEREVIVQAAARDAAAADAPPPFRLRPGLVAEIVRFYDQLRRQSQSVARFEELMAESLSRDLDLDRGAGRMLAQTRFLAAVYRAYERRVAERGAVDEHALRARLIETPAADPIRHAIVTVGDWIADPNGLYPADYDLLTRLPAIETIDLVATEELLASGLHQRLHDWLPGMEEVTARELGVPSRDGPPVLLAPAEASDSPMFVHRDREEELIAIVRHAVASSRGRGAVGRRIGVVFQRPLPYLYIAPEVFGAAGVPYRTFDALPLAAEPYAAAVDMVLECAASQFTRQTLVALLRSPHVRVDEAGPRSDTGSDTSSDTQVTRDSIAALNRGLADARYLGEFDRLRALAREWPGSDNARPALDAAVRVAEQLQPLSEPAPASIQLGRLRAFLESTTPVAVRQDERHARARAAVVGIIDSLAAANAAHDDPAVAIDELAPQLRRWIEEATFEPRSGDADVHLLDAAAARYGDYDTLALVGLIEGEWPERARRNIFYPPGLLVALGWPSEHDRRGAETSAFVDLLRSPASSVALSTFTLDDEALVEPSSLVDEIVRAGLKTAEIEPSPEAFVFPDDMLTLDPPAVEGVADPMVREWAAFRVARTAGSDARYHGAAGPQPSRTLSVSAIETYLTCPFKFFAQYVLRLEEEPEDDEVMDPKKQGQFVHAVFERFFSTWQASGQRAITPDTLDAARVMFAVVAEEALRRLPEAEAALERTRLLGSSVAPGLADVVFRMEAERPIEVVERLLEYRLKGEFALAGPDGPRTIALHGVADRLDLLADGTFRLIDYKLSSAPNKSRALQLPIYGLCAEQRLASYRGRRWSLGEASYIAFRGAKKVIPLFTARADRDEVLKGAQAKLVGAVDAIERGEFPPTPTDVFLCGFCSFTSVCRKDYVGDV